MTALGLLQIVFYIVVLVALAKPLGTFMAAVYEGQRTFLSPLLRPLEGLIYRVAGVDEKAETGWKRYALGVMLVNLVGFLVVYLLQRLQGVLPLNPQDFRRRQRGLLVQHRGELCHQYQLAGLRRRIDDELPHADAGSRGAEFPFRRHRHGRAGRIDSRFRAPPGGRDRQLLGGLHAQHGLHPAALGARFSPSSWRRRAWCRASSPIAQWRCSIQS